MKKYNIEELINACRKYTPLDGRILVHPLKIVQVKQKDYTFDVNDKDKANAGKDPSKHRVTLKKVVPKVNAKYQHAVVLQLPFDETRFKVGDTIVYPIGCLNDFDLVEGVSIARKYDIAGVVSDSNTTIEERPITSYMESKELKHIIGYESA